MKQKIDFRYAPVDLGCAEGRGEERRQWVKKRRKEGGGRRGRRRRRITTRQVFWTNQRILPVFQIISTASPTFSSNFYIFDGILTAGY